MLANFYWMNKFDRIQIYEMKLSLSEYLLANLAKFEKLAKLEIT